MARAPDAPGPAAGGSFRRVPTQFIAALGDPAASSGVGAEHWGLWRLDPGPRGVRLGSFGELASTRTAPAGWAFSARDFWVEEHGLIMEAPEVPIVSADAPRPRRYVVTGDREVTTGAAAMGGFISLWAARRGACGGGRSRARAGVLAVLTVAPDGGWALAFGALRDVTHLPCRSARYTAAAGGPPAAVGAGDLRAFPVAPGAAMPPLAGCAHQDYAVLFVVGVEE